MGTQFHHYKKCLLAVAVGDFSVPAVQVLVVLLGILVVTYRVVRCNVSAVWIWCD